MTSLTEASSGHWASGWQSAVEWPASLNYTGVDIVGALVADNSHFTSKGWTNYYQIVPDNKKAYMSKVFLGFYVITP